MDRIYILVLLSSSLPYSKTRLVAVPLLFVGSFICLMSLLDKFCLYYYYWVSLNLIFGLFSIVKYCLLPFIDMLRSWLPVFLDVVGPVIQTSFFWTWQVLWAKAIFSGRGWSCDPNQFFWMWQVLWAKDQFFWTWLVLWSNYVSEWLTSFVSVFLGKAGPVSKYQFFWTW